MNITIARDSFGGSHIPAHSEAEAAFGLAQAHADDDFNTLQLVMLAAKANLGSALGKRGARADYIMNFFRWRQLVDEQWTTLIPDIVNLIKGYTSGLNA
jgi:acyl-homoserine-lactone acylase